MSDARPLLERAREEAENEHEISSSVVYELIERIEELEMEVACLEEACGEKQKCIEELERALCPFADCGAYIDETGPRGLKDDVGLWVPSSNVGPSPPRITVGHIRKARAVLDKGAPKPGDKA